MRKHIIIVVCFSVIFIIGIAGAAYATPQDALEPLFTLNEFYFESGQDLQNPATLVVVCGTAEEFDLAQPVSVPALEDQALPSSPSDKQESADVPAIPEPSSFVLLGLGLLSILGVTTRKLRKF